MTDWHDLTDSRNRMTNLTDFCDFKVSDCNLYHRCLTSITWRSTLYLVIKRPTHKHKGVQPMTTYATGYTFVIWGKYLNQPKEELDTTDDRDDARYLVGEYRMAFGSDWRVWKTFEKEN